MLRNLKLPAVVNPPLSAVENYELSPPDRCVFRGPFLFLRDSALAQSISLEFVLVYGTRTVHGQRPKGETEYCLPKCVCCDTCVVR